MTHFLKDIRKMTNADIRLHIKLCKVDIATYSGMNNRACMRAIKNLTKFEQIADERGIPHE